MTSWYDSYIKECGVLYMCVYNIMNELYSWIPFYTSLTVGASCARFLLYILSSNVVRLLKM